MNTKKYSSLVWGVRLLVAIMSALFLALLALPAAAQTGADSFGITNSLNFGVTTTTSNLLGARMSLEKHRDIGLELTWQGSAAGNTNNLTLTFGRARTLTSPVETYPRFTWVIPLNGITTNCAYTNIPLSHIGAAPYLQVVSIANGDNGCNATNAVLRLIRKTTQ